MPKAVDTGIKALQCRVKSMQQSSATPSLHLLFWGVAEDYYMLSTLPCSAFLYLQFLVQRNPLFVIVMSSYDCQEKSHAINFYTA